MLSGQLSEEENIFLLEIELSYDFKPLIIEKCFELGSLKIKNFDLAIPCTELNSMSFAPRLIYGTDSRHAYICSCIPNDILI